jgi:hypothetical protein
VPLHAPAAVAARARPGVDGDGTDPAARDAVRASRGR